MLGIFNWLDWSLIAFIVIFALLGFMQGFIKGIISLLSWVASLFFAYLFAPVFQANYTSGWVDNQELSFWISFAIIVVFVLVIGSIIRFFIGSILSNALSIIDKPLGLIFGSLKAIVIISAVVWIFGSVNSIYSLKVWKTSVTIPYFISIAQQIDKALPHSMHKNIHTYRGKLNSKIHRGVELKNLSNIVYR